MAKTLTTPKGTIGQYARLTEPDFKFKEEGVLSCKMSFQLNEQTQAMLDKLDEAYEEAYARECMLQKGKKLKKTDLPYTVEDDTVLIKFQRKANIRNGKTGETIKHTVKFYDTKGQVIPNPKVLSIGEGTIAKMGFQPYFWYTPSLGFGVSLQPIACQIITLVEYEGGGGVNFGEEDGDFSAEDLPTEAQFADESDDSY